MTGQTSRTRRWWAPRSFAATVVLGFLVASASAAFAIWTVPVIYAPTNHGVAKAASLLAPTGPTATANGSAAITVGWTAPAGQLAGAQYRVTRTSGTGSPAIVCTVAAATSSCQDTGLTSGSSYGYSVAALLSGWQSNAATASATTDKATQTISFTSTAPSPATAGGATYTVTATASSGLAVSFALDGSSSGCSLSGSTVTFTAAGTCKVNANQAGNAQFLAAPQVQQAITVNAAASSVVGMTWTNVRVGSTAVTPTCTGTVGSTYSCSVSGGNNAVVSANVTFVNGSGTPTAYSTSSTTVNWTATGKGALSGSVTVAANATGSTGNGATATKNGSNSAQVTVSFNGWTAVLIIN